MKHDIKIVSALVLLFFVSQLVGLGILYSDINIAEPVPGERVIVHNDTIIGPRPEIQGGGTFVFLLFSILIGTALIMVIVKLGINILWKLLFFYAVFMTTSIALGVIVEPIIAFVIGFALALLKVMRQNIIIHNLSEIFIYAGIAVLLVPLMDVFWAAAILIAISIYDYIAVYKVKHMITLAKFQTESKAFAGLLIRYNSSTGNKAKKKHGGAEEKTNAILGGGDIAFPMLFAGAVMESMVLSVGKTAALWHAMIIPVVVSLFLLLLFIKGQKGKFYPAMPILTAGSFIGAAIAMLL